MSKRVKCRCRKCKRVFVTSRADKIYMRHFGAEICPKCEKEFTNELCKGLMEHIFSRKEVANE